MSGDEPVAGARLEASLADLGQHLAWPGTPDLASSVTAHLRAHPRRKRRFTPLLAPLPAPRRAVAFATLLLVLLGGTVLGLSPAARDAVAGWLGLPGIRIDVGGPPPSPSLLGGDLNLGRPVTLEEARERARFEVLQPDPEILGAPDEIYLGDDPTGGRVSLVYRARPGLPSTQETSVGLLLTQFQASLSDELIEKSVAGGGTVDPVSVDGGRGYWIGGGAHVVLFIGADGFPIEETIRLAGPTLVWQQDGLTLRLESALSKPEALGIARTVR